MDELTVAEAEKLLAAGEFGEGTMAPKIEAAISFIGNSAIRRAVITTAEKALDGIAGVGGTVIHK